MAEATLPPSMVRPSGGRTKFLVGGGILLAAVAYLIVTGLLTQGQYFVTVDELKEREVELIADQSSIRASGAVVGETINFDPETQTLSFTMVHIPASAADIEDEGGLALVLEEAVSNPDSQSVEVIIYDEPQPELLQHQAQAIVTGKLGEDGKFYADELLLKCPTRYEEAVPQQSAEVQ